MQMKRFMPRPSLAPFVRAYTVVETDEEATRLLLPEPGLILGLRYRGAATLLTENESKPMPNSTLSGILPSIRRMKTAAESGVLLVMFQSCGAAQFFSQPLQELHGEAAPVDALIPRSAVDRVTTQLWSARTDEARVAIVEQFLLSRIRNSESDALVAAAECEIRATHGMIRIRDLARRLGISQDPLEKRFRKVVGTSPKRFSALIRFRYAVQAHRPEWSLSRLAHEAGYCDQSHFIREFRAIAGLSPGQFFRRDDLC